MFKNLLDNLNYYLELNLYKQKRNTTTKSIKKCKENSILKDWNKLYNTIMTKLKKELPSHLHYHSWGHIEYVITMSQHIAEEENMSEEDIYLIKTAALFHDFGFVIESYDHEEQSVRYAHKLLPEHGYTDDEIEIISGMIRATRIPQQPKNKLEEILADADLEYLGTDSFSHIGNLLFEEVKHDRPNMSHEEWNDIQIWFLKSHHYHTDYCKLNREPTKAQNLQRLLDQKKA